MNRNAIKQHYEFDIFWLLKDLYVSKDLDAVDIVCLCKCLYKNISVHEKLKIHIKSFSPLKKIILDWIQNWGLKNRDQSLYNIYTIFIEQSKKINKATAWSQ